MAPAPSPTALADGPVVTHVVRGPSAGHGSGLGRLQPADWDQDSRRPWLIRSVCVAVCQVRSFSKSGHTCSIGVQAGRAFSRAVLRRSRKSHCSVAGARCCIAKGPRAKGQSRRHLEEVCICMPCTPTHRCDVSCSRACFLCLCSFIRTPVCAPARISVCRHGVCTCMRGPAGVLWWCVRRSSCLVPGLAWLSGSVRWSGTQSPKGPFMRSFGCPSLDILYPLFVPVPGSKLATRRWWGRTPFSLCGVTVGCLSVNLVPPYPPLTPGLQSVSFQCLSSL